jgi:hypothetical protein
VLEKTHRIILVLPFAYSVPSSHVISLVRQRLQASSTELRTLLTLQTVLQDVHRCCTRLQSGVHRAGEETAPAQAAALSCIAAALNTDAGRRDLVELLSLGHPGAVDAPQSQGAQNALSVYLF